MFCPPLTEETTPLAVLKLPPLTEAYLPLAALLYPPLTDAQLPLAVFLYPPLTFTIAVRGELRPKVTADGRGVCFGDEGGTVVLPPTPTQKTSSACPSGPRH